MNNELTTYVTFWRLVEELPDGRQGFEPVDVLSEDQARALNCDQEPAAILNVSGQEMAIFRIENAPEASLTPATRAAVDFLQKTLAKGARPAAKVQAGARRAGISEKAIRRGKKYLGIISAKNGGNYGGNPQWDWSLPAVEGG